MATSSESWLALDVGGANVKAAHSDGLVISLPFELWRQPGELVHVLSRLAERVPPFDRVALTLTAELCDCFPTKRDGVRFVIDAVTGGFPDRPLLVWGMDGRFHPVEDVREQPLLAAAANWLALATCAARLVSRDSGLLIDIGSTTTDLIPLKDGEVVARGRTDTERLQTGELVYAGVRRTPLCALAPALPFRGRATRLAAELFATTLDLFLTLGEIPEDPDDRSTADGRPATRDAARDRLARMVGADRDGFTEQDAVRLSESAREALLARLFEAAGSAFPRRMGRPSVVVVSGSGEFLAHQLASRILAAGGRIVSLSETWGPAESGAACARALVEVVRAWDTGGQAARATPSEPESFVVGTGRTVVVKLGGSLLRWAGFPARLREYLDRGETEKVVIVVGGGGAADFLRELDSAHAIGEKRSHELALRALDLTAHVVAALVPGLTVVERPDELTRVWDLGRVPVFAPRWFLESLDRRSADPLPESWETTTDSIAARLAAYLEADELRLLKSTGLGRLTDRDEASRAGFVDPGFPNASATLRRVTVVNLRADPISIESMS